MLLPLDSTTSLKARFLAPLETTSRAFPVRVNKHLELVWMFGLTSMSNSEIVQVGLSGSHKSRKNLGHRVQHFQHFVSDVSGIMMDTLW